MCQAPKSGCWRQTRSPELGGLLANPRQNTSKNINIIYIKKEFLDLFHILESLVSDLVNIMSHTSNLLLGTTYSGPEDTVPCQVDLFFIAIFTVTVYKLSRTVNRGHMRIIPVSYKSRSLVTRGSAVEHPP